MFGGLTGFFPQPQKKDKEEVEEEEKPKKKLVEKPKLTYLSSKNYSEKFAYLFNNTKYSDCKIKFEKSKKVIPAHKVVLTSSSEYFTILFQSKMVEEQTSEVIIEKDENEEFFLKFLKFLYTGSFDYSNERDIIYFILTSNKYLVKEISDFKIPSKKLLKIIIDYIEEDYDNRIKTFDSLIQYVDFKVFEKDELLLVFKKVKWMSTSLVFLSAMLQKDVEDELGDEDEKEEQADFENIFKSEEEQIVSENHCLSFDKKFAGSKISLSKSNKVVTYSGSGWQGAVLGKSGTKMTVTVKTYSPNVMFGFATKSINKEGNNYMSCGYYLYFNGMTLYGQTGSCQAGQAYGNNKGVYQVQVGDTVGAQFDKKKGEITFFHNGKNLGVAFRGIKDKKLFPAIDFSQQNSSLELVRGKYPKS